MIRLWLSGLSNSQYLGVINPSDRAERDKPCVGSENCTSRYSR